MRPLLGIILLLLPLAASASLKGLVEVLAAGDPLTSERRQQAQQGAEGVFLLGWLAEQGRYGEAEDAGQAAQYFQRAAEQGSYAALSHCWQRCVELNDAVRSALRAGAERNDPEALYLLYRDGRQRSESPEVIDRLLLRAARAGQPEAIGELYAHHFLEWAAGRRTLAQAARKLDRCRREGVTYCYYLSGALHQRQGDSQQALLYFQTLRWLDPALFERHLEPSVLEQLAARLPQQNLEPVRARAAMLLSTQAATGNPRIDRFGYCADDAGTDCVTRFAERDYQCLPAALATTLFTEFRSSRGYRACLERAP